MPTSARLSRKFLYIFLPICVSIFWSCPAPGVNRTAPHAVIKLGSTSIPVNGTSDWGTLLLGVPVYKTFTIGNTGENELNLTGSPLVSITGADAVSYSITRQPSHSIGAGESTAFTVKVIPPAGTTTAAVVVTSDDPDQTTYSFTVTSMGTGAAISLPRTGQTDSRALGDDGDLQMGVAWSRPRFTAGTDVVTDNLTGLMWQKAPSCIYATDQKTWVDALNYCNDLELGGFTDWRLPNHKELLSLRDYSQSAIFPWLNSQGFVCDPETNNSFWTSTAGNYTDSAWSVGMWLGTNYSSPKTSLCYIWAVRGNSSAPPADVSLPGTGQTVSYAAGDDADMGIGAPWPEPRFTDNGDGTVSDKLTGLVWGKYPSITGMTWLDAIAYTETLTIGGYEDWRLPNVNEMGSVSFAAWLTTSWWTDRGFSALPNNYWTSTAYQLKSGDFWQVCLSGSLGTGSGQYDCGVWAVRSP